MAATWSRGSHGPAPSARIEKIFTESEFTGVINLSGRKLKDFPNCSNKFDLTDTVKADLSKNRFSEVPSEVCKYESLEQLNCYHNVIKVIPAALGQLQALVHLNLGRNQLTMLPAFLCGLPSLEVLQVPNNKLVSLPEEVGKLEHLMELDVSCNEITQLPMQIGDLKSLKNLDVRRNLLLELPNSISNLKLEKLDFSSNKISEIPCDIHAMDTLQEMKHENNPLTSPPAHLCIKGLEHIKKYLFIHALKEGHLRGAMKDVPLRKYYRKSGVGQDLRNADKFRFNGSPRDRHKRRPVDSGYSTADSNERMRWSPSESNDFDAQTMHTLSRAVVNLQGHTLFSVNHSDLEEANNLALRAAESVKEQRQEREHQRRMLHESSAATDHKHLAPVQTTQSPSPLSQSSQAPPPTFRQLSGPSHLQLQMRHQQQMQDLPESPASTTAPSGVKSEGSTSSSYSSTSHSPNESLSSPATPKSVTPPPGQIVDAFTRELQRQKSELEARKKRAEQLRLEREQEETDMREREERRRTALRLQEDQKAVMERQREEARNNVTNSMTNSLSNTSLSTVSTTSDAQESSQPPSSRNRVTQSNSFREEKKQTQHQPYRRTVSDTNYNVRYPYNQQGAPTSPLVVRAMEHSISSEEDLPQRNNGLLNHSPQSDSSPTTPESTNQPEQPRVHYIPVIHNSSSSTQGDEFRRRHEVMVNQQRHEAQMIQRRLEAQKQHILRMQKDMVQKWGSGPTTQKIDESEEYNSFSRDSTPNSSFNGSAVANHKSGLPPRCQKVLESMGPELNNMNPAFTIRRNLQHAQEEMEQIDQLRKTIESRLKVTLPENLPAALKDGVVLCHLANHIRPRSVSSIHVPSPAVPKLPMAKCRRNVESFLEACRRMGVEQEKLFIPLEILEERGVFDVAYTVQALISRVQNPAQSAV